MSPRPRSISDYDVVQAALIVLRERGAHQTRLTDVSVVTGLAPATLLQRFGSRDGLLDAVARAFVEEVAEQFRVSASSNLARLATALADLDAASHLVFFSQRPSLGPAYSLELRKQIAFTLAAAVEAGELTHCDIADKARELQIGYYGLVGLSLVEAASVSSDQITQLITEKLADFV